MKANTVLINPRWSFKAHSGITNMKGIDQWSDQEIAALWPALEQRINKDATIFLMVSPTKMALGAHVDVCKDWGKYTPRTMMMWHISNPRGSGRSLYDDSLYPCVVLRTPSRYYRKEDQTVSMRYQEIVENDGNINDHVVSAPMYGMGASYGPEFYEHVEEIGYGPFLQVFDRRATAQHVPDHWDVWIPKKEDMS